MEKTETSLYEDVLKKPKFFLFSALAFLVLIAGTALYQYENVFSDLNLTLSLFGTIVQGFLGLVGFLGAVVIFKLQIIETQSENILVRLQQDLIYFVGDQSNILNQEEAMAKAEYIVATEKEHNQYQVKKVSVSRQRLQDTRSEKTQIETLMINMSLTCFANITVALLGFYFAKIMLLNDLVLPVAFYSLVNVILSVIVIMLAFRVVLGILRPSTR